MPVKNTLSNGYIYNIMASQHSAVPGYQGHDIQDIKNVYEDFNTFKIDPHVPINFQELARFTGSILCKNPSNLTLTLEPDTIIEFDNVFLYGAKNIPYDNLLTSILSTTYKHSFIELYQCIDRLYQVFYIDELYDVLKPNMSFINFLKEIEQSLSWKPSENNSIEKIISMTPSYVYSEVIKLKIQKTQSESKLSSWFYNIRNQLVHLRALQERMDFSSKEWNILLRGTLKIIQYWYQYYDKKLSGKIGHIDHP